MRTFVAALYLPVKIPLTMLRFGWPVILLLIPILTLRGEESDWIWWLGGTLLLAGIVLLLKFFDKFIQRSFPRDFAGTPFLIVSNLGIVDVKNHASALLIPWSSMLSVNWQADPGQSSIVFQYATGATTVAHIAYHGEEWDQPLGELVDIVQAYRPDFH